MPTSEPAWVSMNGSFFSSYVESLYGKVSLRQKPISEFWFASVSKRVFVQNVSYENEFDLHENKLVDETHFHKNGLALRLVLTQRQTRIRNGLMSLRCILKYQSNLEGVSCSVLAIDSIVLILITVFSKLKSDWLASL